MYLVRKEKTKVGKMLNALSDGKDYEDVGYWRKANQIHRFFVEHCAEGIDDCKSVKVSKEQLEMLLEKINKILKDKKLAGKELPTNSGFFFGDTDYSSYYFTELRDTKKIIEKVLKTTDWETQFIEYWASW